MEKKLGAKSIIKNCEQESKMKELFEKIFQGKEGNILLLGLFLTLFLVVFIIISYQFDAGFTHKITGMVFSNLFVGRVPSLSFGYAAELSHFTVIAVNTLTEFILVAIIYPLFIFSVNGVLKVKMLESFFSEIQLKKQKHKKKFDKYGMFGLFIFVFFPFWMTGPIVGAIIGFLIGLKHYTTITIVFIATAIAISLWGLFLQEIVDFMLNFDSQIAWIILCIFIFLILFFRFKGLIKKLIDKK